MKNYKNTLVIMAIALIIFNSYLLVTNFRLNRQAAAVSYTKENLIKDDKLIHESNIRNLKKILEDHEEDTILLIKVITVSGDRIGFEAEAEKLDEIEKLHTFLSKIYHPKKITVNITKQIDRYKALFEYTNNY